MADFASVQGGADPISGHFRMAGASGVDLCTANFERGTNFLPEIRVGGVVASVGDPSFETSLPFSQRDLQLVRSGSAAVLGVDADGGSPDGDFTKECGGRVAARWCPDGLFA